MPEHFLGIDTSNYRTSAAIYNAETGEWVNRGGLLTVPEGAIGLRQSDALFQHTVRLHEKIEALPQGEVRAIGVSTRPRAVEGSYMPCFLAGESVARSAAHLLSVPLFTVSHQQGHIAAAALSAARSRGKSARSAVPVRRRTGRAGAYRRAGKGFQTQGKRV